VRYGGAVNRLAASTSAYLREHAANPVDWYPWGEEAFARALRLDRPLLVSIGYAACHWCHVMAQETFADPTIAARQNALVVSVKVDREERPDVDAVYMDAVQRLTGGGGWPMTVFCLPDGRPFHAGTYYPPRDQGGMPGFPRVLDAIATAWGERRDEVTRAAEQLTSALIPQPLRGRTQPGPPVHGEQPWAAAVPAAAARRLVGDGDPVHGGFGAAPKFPNAPALHFLLGRVACDPADPEWPQGVETPGGFVERTLDAMARGGIHDQVGGGFHRYTIDAGWRVPHFEKMLVDQAQLATLYSHAHALFGRERDRRVVADTIEYLLADLAVSDGGFAASTDADSEGREGRYFVWTAEQLRNVLGDEDGSLAAQMFGVSRAGNFDDGASILWLPRSVEEVAAELGGTGAEVQEAADGWRERLRAARAGRVPPRRDDSRLTGWNALAAMSLLDAGVVLARPDHRQRGLDTLSIVLERARRGGRLRHLWHPGAPPVEATLSDVAALGLGLVAAHQATLDVHWLEEAAWIADAALPRYRDQSGPGWFDAPADHDPRLPVRPRSLEDGAVASGTALAALFALRAGALLGSAALLADAEEVLESLLPTAARVPLAFGGLLQAAEAARAGPVTVAVGGGTADQREALLAVVQERYRPHVLCLTATGPHPPGSHPSLVGWPPPGGDRAAAVVCRGTVCALPEADPGGLRVQLETP